MTQKNKFVIQLITSINLGGAENIAINLAEDCDNFNILLVEIYASKNKFSYEKKKNLREKNIDFLSLSGYSKRISLLIAPLKLFVLLIKLNPDIIHSHTDLPDFVLSVVLKLRTLFGLNPIKIVRTIHNTVLWPTHKKIGEFVESSFNNDFIVTISESANTAYEKLRISYNFKNSNYKMMIYNGCKLPENIYYNFNLNKNKINILFCGRLEFQKGIDILLSNIKLINLTFPDKFVFYIVGQGSFKSETISATRQNQNVFFYDSILNISNKIHLFDFLLLPSRFEGLGLISIEASLSKVPVLSSGVDGLMETLPTNWPLNFDLNIPNSLIDLLKKVIDKDFDLTLIKKEAFLFAKDKFSYESMIKKYSQLYNSILRY